jgi:UTP--glucose-1-phosphate uridylyltransferase
MNVEHLLQTSAAKMRGALVSEPVIAAFGSALNRLANGDKGLMPEASIEPAKNLPALESLPEAVSTALIGQLAVIKLNGGLGTGMGLDRAKSLIRVKGDDTFLDLTARQILHLRNRAGAEGLAFYLMNSFSTQKDTLDYLGSRHPELMACGPVDFLQSKVPKLEAATLEPAAWPADPQLEWCPPGHGDIYPSLLASGLLEELLAKGVKYAFVSNSDNLGATVDARLLNHFAESGASFMMEVAARTAADRKGGHLARRIADGRLVLRESAQCPAEDTDAFQDIERHGYFNTNNLWLRLDHLKAELDRNGGMLPLPLIANHKTVDPKVGSSTKVVQLETAMGAAIECFPNTSAVVVPRSRFAPVKTTADLLAVRSDAYEVTDDWRLQLAASRDGVPPIVDLDGKFYKTVGAFEPFFAAGTPSLLGCSSLTVKGAVAFPAGVVCRGRVVFFNGGVVPATVTPGVYEDADVAV